MRVELLSPRSTGIRKQDIHMVGRLAHFVDEMLDALELGGVGRDRDGPCAWLEVGEGVERGDGFGAGVGLAGGDVDFGGAGLEETGGMG